MWRRFQKGEKCGGLGDVYWSCAFLAKKLHEFSDEHGTEGKAWWDLVFDAHTQLSALLEDSGALSAAMEHVGRAAAQRPRDGSLRFRQALLVPAVASRADGSKTARKALKQRVAALKGTTLETLDQTSMPGTFYVVYLGGDDANLMRDIGVAYQIAFPSLRAVLVPATYERSTKLKVGFVSSYWRDLVVLRPFAS